MEAVQGVGRVGRLDPPMGDQSRSQAVVPIDMLHALNPDVLGQDQVGEAGGGEVGGRACQDDPVVGQDFGPASLSLLRLALRDPDQAGHRAVVDLGRQVGAGAARLPDRERRQRGGVAEPGDRLVGLGRLAGDPRPIGEFGQGQRPIRLGAVAEPGLELRRGGGRVALASSSKPSRFRTDDQGSPGVALASRTSSKSRKDRRKTASRALTLRQPAEAARSSIAAPTAQRQPGLAEAPDPSSTIPGRSGGRRPPFSKRDDARAVDITPTTIRGKGELPTIPSSGLTDRDQLSRIAPRGLAMVQKASPGARVTRPSSRPRRAAFSSAEPSLKP